VHGAATRFEALEEAPNVDTARRFVDALVTRHRTRLLRMKGMIRLADGTTLVVQFTLGDRAAQLDTGLDPTQSTAASIPGGVTLILRVSQ
jgi:G3E family GTPase